MGRSRGGLTTKIHAAADASGLPIRLATTPGQTHDIVPAKDLLAGLKEEATAALEGAVPFPKRLGRAAEFAQLVVEIVKNPYLNAEVIRLDGGLRMAAR